MAIVFITGSAGAGKSYYAVKRIVENLKKDTNLVVSNIDGLDRAKLSFYLGKEVNNLWTLDEFLATALSFCNMHYDGNYRNAFLTILNVDYWKRFILPKLFGELGYRKVIFYLDEFQSIIDEDTELTQLQKFFFDYHRHLGLDFYIITRSIQRMNKAIRNLVEIELRLVSLCIFGISNMAVLKTIIGGVPVKKSIVKYDPKIFALYRSAFVEHMKGVKGKPPVMLFVALAVALFAIVQLGSYVKSHGGVIPKPKVSQAQENEVKNEKRPSFFDSPFPSSSGSSGSSSSSFVSGSSPSYSYPSSYSSPSVSSESSSFPSSPSGSFSLPSPSPSSSVGGYGYIVIEVARPSARLPASSGLELSSGPKVVELP
jgi:zona occludens toxin (predicted ATPase)